MTRGAPRATATGSASDFLPERHTLTSLREAAARCRGCPLWARGTQTVFGAGPRTARVMLVGEQPGNDEDLAGAPFVGPAGRVLDRALQAAGIARDEVYVTNVVKHFKWVAKGKRRIHEKPNRMEISACLPWLEAEFDVIKPEIMVCLGATAAQALLGPQFRVTRDRGRWVESRWPARVLATVHPSSILRARDEASRHAEMEAFERDLHHVAEALRARRSA